MVAVHDRAHAGFHLQRPGHRIGALQLAICGPAVRGVFLFSRFAPPGGFRGARSVPLPDFLARGRAALIVRTADWNRPQLRPHHGRVRGRAYGWRQHPRRYSHALHQHLRPGAGPELFRGEYYCPGAGCNCLCLAVVDLLTEPEPVEDMATTVETTKSAL